MVDDATRYAEDVVGGRIVTGELARLSCERHLRDLETAHERGFLYHPSVAEKKLRFFRKHCRHVKGPLAGKPIVFQPWQQFRLCATYGWLREDGRRRFKRSWNEVAKKNGKTTEGACVALNGLCADGEGGAEVYAVATRREQARLCFDAASSMGKKSRTLRRRLKIGNFSIKYPANDSIFKPLGADSDAIEGTNPSTTIIDEVHVHKNRKAYDNIGTAQGARDQPLNFVITTAGQTGDPNSLYMSEHNDAVNVLKGVHDDDSLFVYIAMPDEDDDWRDEAIWIKGNPNLGESVTMEFLRERCEKAKRSPADVTPFKQKNLNMLAGAATELIDPALWNELADDNLTWDALKGRPCFYGVDLSSTTDLSSVGYVFPPAGPDPNWVFKWDTFLPDHDLAEKAEKSGGQYKLWQEQGWLTVVPGVRIDYDFIRKTIEDRAKALPCSGIGVDFMYAVQLSNRLQDEGFDVQVIRQGHTTLGGPTRELMDLLVAKQIRHDGNPVAAWCAGNASPRYDANLNIVPDRRNSRSKIDCLAALLNGLTLALADRGDEQSVYAKRGLTVLGD